MATSNQDFAKAWGNYYKALENPISEMASLNVQMLNNGFSRNARYMNELLRAKKIEDVVATQSKFMAEANAEICDYFQQTASNMSKCLNESHSHFSDMASGTCGPSGTCKPSAS